MAKKKSVFQEFSKGILKDNPLLRLVLGTCPALAVTTSAVNGIGMGVAATFVLLCSNIVISLLRKIIPTKVRIPAYITVIASFVTIVQFLLQAYAPSLDQSLGIFIPLITVNCIILGRAEAFAGKNGVLTSAIDGIGMGVGFTAALFLMGGLREIFGNGSLLGYPFSFVGGANVLQPMLIMILPPGGFFIYGILIALSNKATETVYKSHPELAMSDDDAIPSCCCTGGASELKAAFTEPALKVPGALTSEGAVNSVKENKEGENK